MRVDYAIRQHQQWYKGDGMYGDGPDFHWDYYNSFVIHPMLLDVLDACASSNQAWARLQPAMLKRAQRYAAIQERLVSPEGTFPPIGRSLAYRCGAFQVLAHMSPRHALPEGVTPGQSRNALTKVIKRTIEAPKTFDENGWLTIGFSGHQPGVGETYISTGSLYSQVSRCCPSACRRRTRSGVRRRNRRLPNAPGAANRFRSTRRTAKRKA